MHSADRRNNNRRKKSSNIVWLSAALLAILVVATISVAGSCLYNYAHQSDCQISLYDGQVKEAGGMAGILQNAASQKKEAIDPVIQSQAAQYTGSEAKAEAGKSAFEVDNDTQIWKTETAIELFQAEYKNKDGAVTVKSADGRKVIAPGTEGSYTFSLKNTSDSDADYQIWVEAKLNAQTTGVPIETRMSGDSGWLLGGKNSWEQAAALDGVTTEETIGAGREAEYTIYWQWPFEQGTDVFDTGLADASVNQEMSYTVIIHTLTAAATDSAEQEKKDQNPVKRALDVVKTGDSTRILFWLILLTAATGTILCLVIGKQRKNGKEKE